MGRFLAMAGAKASIAEITHEFLRMIILAWNLKDKFVQDYDDFDDGNIGPRLQRTLALSILLIIATKNISKIWYLVNALLIYIQGIQRVSEIRTSPPKYERIDVDLP